MLCMVCRANEPEYVVTVRNHERAVTVQNVLVCQTCLDEMITALEMDDD